MNVFDKLERWLGSPEVQTWKVVLVIFGLIVLVCMMLAWFIALVHDWDPIWRYR